MVLLILSACADPTPAPSPSPPPQGMAVSAALDPAALCDGRSPAIAWSGHPEDSGSFALTLIAPSAEGPWVHWMAWDIPADQASLAAGIRPTQSPPIQGIGSSNAVGYDAPCPQPGERHVLRVFALTSPLGLPPTTTWSTLGAAIQEHTLSWGMQVLEVTGGDD